MKSIYSDIKQQQLSNGVLNDNNIHDKDNNLNDYAYDDADSTPTSFTDFNTDFAAIVSTPTTTTTTSTYDSLERPFKYDKKRGRWSSGIDFYFACTSHAFGSIIFSEIPLYACLFGGVYQIPAYLIAILLYAIPVFAIQTFLGQFSTSGTISAFRVAPLFKGIGYSAVVLNLISLIYYAVIAAVPLIYAANSLYTVIPWMSCKNSFNSKICSNHTTYDVEETDLFPHATVEFFRYMISNADNANSDYAISWPIVSGVVIVWLLTLVLILRNVTFIGKFFRCIWILLITFFIAIFVHLLIYMDIRWDTISSYFPPIMEESHNAVVTSFRAAIFMATWMLGPGWGSVLTLASHNSFHRNSEKFMYWISITHVLLVLMAMLCGRIAYDHFEDHVGLFHFHVEEEHHLQFLYLCFAYLFGSFTSLPNLWCFLFFSMIFLAELSAVIIQMMTVLRALFDEHEKLRTMKTRITIGLVLAMMLISVYFCTKQGFEHLDILPTTAVLTTLIISFVLLIVTTWIYGRERFQCDLQFMLGKTISNFKIFLIRSITPAFLVIIVFQVLFFLETDDPPTILVFITQSIVYIVAITYMIYKICQTSGKLRNRLKQCFVPHDWHPVDADNRRFYDEIMGTSEMLVISNEEFVSNA